MKIFKILLVVLVSLFVMVGCNSTSIPSTTSASVTDSTTASTNTSKTDVKQVQSETNKDLLPAKVTRVVDGDTIEISLNGKKEKVRLIGVDTPETVDPNEPVQPYGPEASDYTKKALNGKNIYLEFDVQQRDKYNRLLCYVYLNDKTTFFNGELIRLGYARVMTIPPNVKYSDTFVKLQKEARDTGRGLWGVNIAEEDYYVGSIKSDKFHWPDCKSAKNISPKNLIKFNTREDAVNSGYSPCAACCKP